MLESTGKRLAIITVHRIVYDNSNSFNSCKAQYGRKCGKIKREKDIRDKMMNELKNELKDMQITKVLVVGDFNEDENSNNIQEFMVEMGLHDFFL